MIPHVALCPKIPHQPDGVRIDPPMSLPISPPVSPAAMAAAAPPDDPPGVRSTSHGLFVVPKIGLYVCTSLASVGTFVFPNTTAPAPRSRATGTASAFGT